FYRLGGESPIKVDVRILYATNKNLQELMEAGKFREDLYYRLAVLVLHIPPLRKRKRDIIPLLEYYVGDFNKKHGTRKQISDEGAQHLLEYEWPGNIRELENLVQRVMINSDEDMISQVSVLRELSNHRQWETNPCVNGEAENITPYGRNFRETMDEHERQIIEEALLSHGSTRKAAEALGITQATFMRKKKKHQI
ncbi:MAG: sigma 54-interacting transcriptional regulator, partial [Anaerovoracaceae bacterium]